MHGSNTRIVACILLRQLRNVSYFPPIFWRRAVDATSQGDPIEATNKLKDAIIELEPRSVVLLTSILAALKNSRESIEILTRTFVSALFSQGNVRFSIQDAATFAALLSLPDDVWQLAVKQKMYVHYEHRCVSRLCCHICSFECHSHSNLLRQNIDEIELEESRVAFESQVLESCGSDWEEVCKKNRILSKHDPLRLTTLECMIDALKFGNSRGKFRTGSLSLEKLSLEKLKIVFSSHLSTFYVGAYFITALLHRRHSRSFTWRCIVDSKSTCITHEKHTRCRVGCSKCIAVSREVCNVAFCWQGSCG